MDKIDFKNLKITAKNAIRVLVITLGVIVADLFFDLAFITGNLWFLVPAILAFILTLFHFHSTVRRLDTFDTLNMRPLSNTERISLTDED